MILVGILIGVSLLITVLAFRFLPTDAHGASAIALGLLATDFVVRPFELLVGLDSLFPDVVFESQSTEAAMVRAQNLYIVWVSVFTAFSWAAHEAAGRSRLLALPWLPSDASIPAFLPVLSAAALAGTAVLWARYGISDLARVAKSLDVAIPNYLRSPAILLAYLGMALSVYGYTQGRRRLIGFGLVAFVFGAGLVFTWGARDASVLPLVIVVGAMATGIAAKPRWVDRARFTALAGLVVLLIVGAGLGLRAGREYVAYGRTLTATNEGSIIRRLAVTTNHTRYDAVLLVFDETDPTPERPGIGIFGSSLRLALSPNGTEGSGVVVPARAVRHTVQPNVRNGWPITAPGDWFYAAGWWAVPLGAALSGLAFGLVDRWRQAQKERSWVASTAVVAIFATTVTWGGIGVTMPARLRSLLVLGLALMALWNLGWNRLSKVGQPS